MDRLLCRLACLSVLALAFALPVSAQGWMPQTSGVATALRGICFLDPNNGYISGSGGTILHTTNAGSSWTSQTAGTSGSLFGIFFTDAANGTVVGSSGAIVRTTNGGSSWFAQTSGTSNSLDDVWFTSSTVGTIVGGNGTILRTTNGGTTWTTQTSGTTNSLNAVVFLDGNTGIAVGGGGTILRTTDGGTAWVSQSSPSSSNLNDVAFADANNGTIVGAGGTILHTTNGGTTWASQSSGSSQALFGVNFSSIAKGTAVGASGTILRTKDLGVTWTPENSGTTKNLFAVYFSDDNTGTASGETGTILRTLSGGVDCPAITLDPSSLPGGTVFGSYGQTMAAAGGAPPYAFAVTSGTLPAGLTLTSAGYLSGIPTTAGSSTFTMTATDDDNCRGSRTYTLAISCPAMSIGPSSLPEGGVNSTYSESVTASGGTGPYAFSVSAGSQPPGLTLSSSGSLFGIPTNAGSFTFTVQATDIQGCTATRSYTATIRLALGPPALSDGVVGTAYDQTLTAEGGTSPFAFALGSGSLPPGLTLSGAGTISGLPTTVGSYTFTVGATDASGNTGTQTYTITIDCQVIPLSPALLPGGVAGMAYTQSILASNGISPYAFFLASGLLPPGLSVSSGGAISGIPTAIGSYSFTILVTDAQGCTGSKGYTIAIDCPAIALSPPALPHGVAGSPYSQTLSGSGGTEPQAFTVSSGTLPNGLSLSSSGVLSGTPATVGSSTFVVRVTDAQGCTGSRSYTVLIDCPAITLNPSTLPDGPGGAAYSQTVSASGGTAPYSFSVTGGSLPSGLVLSSSGILSGTPTTVGAYSFTISATDAQSCTASRNYDLTVTCPAIALSPTSMPDGIVGAAFSQTVTAAGGAIPYAFSITSGSLPAGLSLSPAGVISGTPTTAGSSTCAIRAADAQGCIGSGSYTITIQCPTIALSPSALPAGTTGAVYSQTVSASGGTSPYAFMVSAGTLPAGLALSAGGVLSGTPTSTGTSTFTVTATDAQSCLGSRSYTLTTNCPSITVYPASFPDAEVGTVYGQTITAGGGSAPHLFSVTAGSLPAGLSLGSDGVLSGTPTLAGPSTFTVTATDAYGCAGSRAYTLGTNCPTLALSSLANGTVGSSYSQTVTATGGTPPHAFVATSGSLPAGLLLSSSGVLSGTPAAAGSFSFTIRSTDAYGCTGTRSYVLTVSCPAITLSGLPDGTAGTPYSQTIAASGGTLPSTFLITAGTLPGGVSLSADGTLAGTPSMAGTFTFTVRATDAHGCSGDKSYALTMTCPPITISPASLPNGTAMISYSQTLSASGGTAPYTCALVAGSLPSGLTLSSSGTLSGTPTVNSVFTFTVRFADASGCFQDREYTISIGTCPTITLSPSTLPNGSSGSPYSQTMTATGGSAPHTFAVTSGSLPPGLSLSAGGVLSGTPTTAGVFTCTIRATDHIGCSGSESYTLVVCGTISLSALTGGTVGAAESQTITATGGTAPYAFALAGGSLPSGLSLSSAGVLSGTPTTAQTTVCTVQATDANGCSGSGSYSLTMVCPAITLNPPTVPNGVVGSAYGQTLLAGGGTAPYTFALGTGTLPAGLAISPSGTVSGTPTTVGTYPFTVTVTDIYACAVSTGYAITVDCPAITVSPASIPDGTVGAPFSQTFTGSGGAGPYTFAVSSGSLPGGLSLSSSGNLTGIPTAANPYSFTVTVTDPQGCTGSRSYTATMSCPAVALSPPSLPGGTVGMPYSQAVTAGGGTSPYTVAVVSGSVPPGLTLSATGMLSGSPTTIGTYDFTLGGTDAHACAGMGSYSITIDCPAISVLPASLPGGAVGTFYSQSLSASGATPPYSFAVPPGTLPAGMALSPGGLLSGTPTTVGSSSFTVTVTDAQGCSGARPYTVGIGCPVILVNPPSLPGATVGIPYSQTLAASNGTPAYVFAVTGGTLPTGLSLSAGGALTGTPASANTFAFTVTVTDAQGCSATQAYSVTAACRAITLSPSTVPNSTVGAAYSQTISATGGTAPYTFAVSAGSVPPGLFLSPAGVLSGIPAAGGTFSFTVAATDANGCGGSQAQSVFISVIPRFTVTPTNLFFGDVTVGRSKEDSVTVTNIGTGTLTINSVSSDNVIFSITPSSASISPGASSFFRITFVPTSSAAYAGTMTFTHDGEGSPGSVGVSGTGVIPGFEIARRLAFGDVLVGSSKKDSVTIVNGGSSALTITSAISDHPSFMVSPNAATIPPFGGQKFMVVFAPAAAGSQSGHIVFSHNAFGSPDTVAVAGAGVAPGFAVSPSACLFGNLVLGSARQDSFIVTNTGTSLLSITGASSSDPNFVVVPASGSVAPSASMTFFITYAPIALGADSSSVTLFHNAAGSPDTVVARGAGATVITVRKLRDHDGNLTTLLDQAAVGWPLTISRGGIPIAQGDMGLLSAMVTEAGTYTACEADGGPGWHRLNGNLSLCDTLTVTSAPAYADTFINFHENTIVLSKQEDRDGDFRTTSDRVPKSWYLEVRQGDASGPVVASGTGTSLAATGLGDGTYAVLEVDSSGWIPLGYIRDGTPIESETRVALVTISAGGSASVVFVDAPPSYSQTFRTFTPDGLAEKRAVKKKPIASRFCARFVNTTGATVNGLVMSVKASSNAPVVHTIESSGPFPLSSSIDGRTWQFAGAEVPDGETVTICGVGNKAHGFTIEKWNWVINGVQQPTQARFTPPNQIPLYPMPNFANVRNEVFSGGGFGSGGLVVGIPRPDSSKYYAWARIPNSLNLLSSLVDRSGYHAGPPRGFDALNSGKALKGELKKVPPLKHTNSLFADLAALRFGIVASAMGKTPPGLGELIYDDGTSNPYNGMMVKRIAERGDSMMMGYYQERTHRFASGAELAELDSVIRRINLGFSGSIDTLSDAVTLVLKGTRRLLDVKYLRSNPAMIPARIMPNDLAGSGALLPEQFRLYQNYPNPFNPSTTISFDLPLASVVTLKIYNTLGQDVATVLRREEMDEGTHEVEFDAGRFASGVYFYRIIAEAVPDAGDESGSPAGMFVDVKTMLLVK